MANLFESPRYIAVEGPIRVGKSTLARILGERLNAQRVIDEVVQPVLDVWKALPARSFPNYAAGTLGPEAAAKSESVSTASGASAKPAP